MPLKRTEVDPYRNYIYRVEIDGITQAGFSEVTIGAVESPDVEYREGDEITTPRKGPGLTKFGDVVLKWGLTDSRELFDWRQRIVDGVMDRRNVSIVVLDDQGTEKIRWQCVRAYAKSLDISDLNAKGTDVAVMSLTLSHEGVRQL
jgi:phage tail-like protein